MADNNHSENLDALKLVFEVYLPTLVELRELNKFAPRNFKLRSLRRKHSEAILHRVASARQKSNGSAENDESVAHDYVCQMALDHVRFLTEIKLARVKKALRNHELRENGRQDGVTRDDVAKVSERMQAELACAEEKHKSMGNSFEREEAIRKFYKASNTANEFFNCFKSGALDKYNPPIWKSTTVSVTVILVALIGFGLTVASVAISYNGSPKDASGSGNKTRVANDPAER